MTRWMTLLAALSLTACGGDWFSFDKKSPRPAPRATEPPATARELVDQVEQALRLMPACDDAQRDLVAPLWPSLLLTADADAGNPDAAWLADLLDVEPFAEPPLDGADGTYTQDVPGGELQMRFVDSAGIPLEDDPYAIDSYLLGASVDPESWAALLEAPEQRQAVLVHWEEEGPLAPGLDSLANPVVLELSVADMALALWGFGDLAEPPYLGGLGELTAQRIEATATLSSETQGTLVQYEASWVATVDTLQTGAPAAVDLTWMEASSLDSWAEVTSSSLQTQSGQLSGSLDLVMYVEGSTWEATLSFDQGFATTSWTCHHGCT